MVKDVNGVDWIKKAEAGRKYSIWRWKSDFWAGKELSQGNGTEGPKSTEVEWNEVTRAGHAR
jgi:hypothetical protein